MVADEQRVFHGTGGDFKILQNKSHGKEQDDEQLRQRGEKIHRRFNAAVRRSRPLPHSVRLSPPRDIGFLSFFSAYQLEGSRPARFIEEVRMMCARIPVGHPRCESGTGPPE